MLTILVGALIGGLLILLIALLCDEDGFEAISAALLGAICGALVGFAIAVVTAVTLPVVKTTTKTTSMKLMAFSDSHRVQGSFFLGCGSIQDVDYYFYYSVDPKDGAILQGKVPVNETRLYEQDREDGLLEIWTTKYVRGKSIWALKSGQTETSRPSYKIYVPRGTVLRRFVADLE